MELSQIVNVKDWSDWPAASPTSRYRINLRFYTVADEDGASLRFDIGAPHEELLESLYLGMALDKRVPGMTPADFETFIRAIYQARINNLLPYTLQLCQYAVLTADEREIRHSLGAEQRILLRSLRLLPYRIFPSLVEQPTTWQGKLQQRFAHLRTVVSLWFWDCFGSVLGR